MSLSPVNFFFTIYLTLFFLFNVTKNLEFYKFLYDFMFYFPSYCSSEPRFLFFPFPHSFQDPNGVLG